MSKVIDIGEVLGKSWKLMKDNLGFSVGVGVISVLVSILLDHLNKYSLSVYETPVFAIVSMAVALVLQLGLIKVFLSLVDGGRPTFDDLWSTSGYLLKYFGAALLMAVPILVGFVLLIIPGIYLYVRWQFFSILIIDKNLGPIKALKESWRLTAGRTIDMLLVFAVTVVLVLAGSLALGIGLIITLPLSLIFLASIYRILNPVVVEVIA